MLDGGGHIFCAYSSGVSLLVDLEDYFSLLIMFSGYCM
jgi:hypothetical protein